MQKPRQCEWFLHAQDAPVSLLTILAACLGESQVGKMSSPSLSLLYPFFTYRKKSSMGADGGGRDIQSDLRF
jgi:hypothetical protein